VSGLAWNWHVAIAGGPSGSLIVWSDYDRLNGALLSQSDTVTPLAFPAGSGHRPTAAWNRDTFLVVATTWGPDLRVMRVDAYGNVRESIAPITQRSAQFPGYTIPDVEPFGDAFLLLWSENKLLAAVINREGFVADGPSPVGGDSPTFGAAGTQFVTQHPIDHPTHPSRVFIQSIDWTPEPTPAPAGGAVNCFGDVTRELIMKAAKQRKLEAAGWRVGDAREFLSTSRVARGTRVAKMEAADPTVSVDLLVKCLLATGAITLVRRDAANSSEPSYSRGRRAKRREERR